MAWCVLERSAELEQNLLMLVLCRHRSSHIRLADICSKLLGEHCRALIAAACKHRKQKQAQLLHVGMPHTFCNCAYAYAAPVLGAL